MLQKQNKNAMSQTEPLTAAELEQAFEVFNRVSRELDTSYRELEGKVAGLTQELSAARTARLEELAEKERLAHRLSSLVSALPGGVLILNRNRQIIDVNPEAIELLGEPLIGESWDDVIERAAVNSPEPGAQEVQLKNSKRISVTSRVLDQSGDSVVLITDVTNIHVLQEQLGRKKRLTSLGEMSARLAHQIRTPLSSTTLYLSQLSRPELSVAERQRVTAKVSERLDHLGQLVNSMLSFVRGGSFKKEVLLLNTVLHEFSAVVQPQLEKSESTLRIVDVDDSLMVEGDSDALVGALTNIAMNAVDATEGPVNIEVWVGALNPEQLQIVIRDNGPGISQDVVERIFDPFFTTRAQGTGLGLAVVEMTVAAHGGEVTAQNRRAGGAEFVITLPMVSTAVDTVKLAG